jgi:hypothetical protein
MHVVCFVQGKIRPSIRRFIIPDDKRPKREADDSYRLQPKLRMYGALPSLQHVLRNFDKNVLFACHNKFSVCIKMYLMDWKKKLYLLDFSVLLPIRSYVREIASDLCSPYVC